MLSRTSSPRFQMLLLLLLVLSNALLVKVDAAAAASSVNVAKLTMMKDTNQNNDNDNQGGDTAALKPNNNNNNNTVSTSRIRFRWWNNHKGPSRFSSVSSKRKKQSEEEDVALSKKKQRQRRRTTHNDIVPQQSTVNQTLMKRLKSILSSSTAGTAWPTKTTWDAPWKRHYDEFMDRVALVSSWLLSSSPLSTEDDAVSAHPNEITPQSDLDTWPPRSFHIVTTASLPWMTGTAVNPLLRAAYLYEALMERQAKEQLCEQEQQREQEQEEGTGEDDAQEDAKPKNLVSVTLVVPWLEREQDQEQLYNRVFASPDEQEAYIRHWLAEQAGMPEAAQGIQILFYVGRYHKELGSIFAMGDMIQDVILKHNQTALDVCILEEPEHCNWYRAPSAYSWTSTFQYVCGIIHTNYKEYAATAHGAVGLFTAPALAMICSAMVRAYCHRVVKLSDTLQAFCPEKEVTSNVHGVRQEFWQQGLALSKELEKYDSGEAEDLLMEPRVYFLGKLLWAKGLDILLDLEEYYHQMTGSYFDLDVYGSGQDSEAIQQAFQKSSATKPTILTTVLKTVAAEGDTAASTPPLPFVTAPTTLLNSLGSLHVMAKHHWSKMKNSLMTQMEIINMPRPLVMPQLMPQMWRRSSRDPIPANFLGRVDHAHLPHNYTVFVNPSISEVLCTATAEALAMGKFVIVPYHPSNYFFLQFPNCLPYRNKLEFVANLRWALTHNPKPLTNDQAMQFSWHAATRRLFEAAAMTRREAAAASSNLEGERITWFHNEVLGKGERGDFMRRVLGAGPASDQVLYQRNHRAHDTEDKDDDDGLGKGFSQSWFAKSIRSAWSDLVGFGVA